MAHMTAVRWGAVPRMPATTSPLECCFQKPRLRSLLVKSVDKRASNKFWCLKQATEWQKANVDACEALLDELCRQQPHVRTHPCAHVSQTCGRAHLSLDCIWGTLTTSTTIMDFKQKVMHGPALHPAILGWPCNLLTSGGLPANLSQSEILEMTGNSMSLAALVKILLPICTAWRVCSDGAAAADLKNCLDYARRAASSFDPSDSACGV